MPDEPVALSRVSVPVPDPTLLTTQQLIREIKALQDIISAQLDGVRRDVSALDRLIDEKIDCVTIRSEERHKALQMQFHEKDVRFEQVINSSLQMARTTATAIEEKTANLQALHNEKFISVEKQFEQRDVALISTLQATKDTFREQNVSASMAIAKSEAATVKQIDQIQLNVHTAIGALESKISDIKDRLTTIEGRTAGQVEQRGETQGTQVQWVGIIALGLSLLVALGGVMMVVLNDKPSNGQVIIEQPLPGSALRQQGTLP